MTTFPSLLADRLRRDPGRPFLTFYDDTTGERTELSVTTYANWVAKAASLLVEEGGLERGDAVVVDLPPHWLGPVVLGAAWSAGLVVLDARADPPSSPDPTGRPGAVVCGPAGVDRWAAESAEKADLTVFASALLPLGTRFAEPPPAGVHDLGVEIWSQPDAFVAFDPPADDDPAYAGTGVGADPAYTQAQVCALEAPLAGARLLTTADPLSPAGLALVTGLLRTDGSLVLVVGATPERLRALAESERATPAE